ncbi:uncharacterized protein LOC121728992 [Aricia agestis]|uniref:uncharacterized protein LOC121728992 n=1 Tax=Aricia agestis TaxID=91739 RepID=UPI001C2064A5|nr:uncharacterized protein LOC121728992 [Aricia agestis]
MNDEFDTLLFNYETTHRTDYRIREFQLPQCLQIDKTAPTPCVKTRTPSDALKDIHTLSDWKRECVPFDLFIHRKEILRTNPTHMQKAYAKPQDLERERVQKTRPRLIMTPAVSIDDIESQEARQLLISDVYLSESERARRDVTGPTLGAKTVPFLQLPAPANPITLPPLLPPYVSPEWRLRSASWDRRQLRARVDAHREFFLRRQTKIA